MGSTANESASDPRSSDSGLGDHDADGREGIDDREFESRADDVEDRLHTLHDDRGDPAVPVGTDHDRDDEHRRDDRDDRDEDDRQDDDRDADLGEASDPDLRRPDATDRAEDSDDDDSDDGDRDDDDRDDDSDDEEERREEEAKREQFAKEHDPADHDVTAGAEFRRRGDLIVEEGRAKVMDHDGNYQDVGDQKDAAEGRATPGQSEKHD